MCHIPQDRWQELVKDIELGTVSRALTLEPTLRSRLELLMKPDPKRANQICAHFQKGTRGLAKRLWPHLHLVLAVDSGSNQIYGEMLRENYCLGVPFYSPFYAATEGRNQHVSTPGAQSASVQGFDQALLLCRSHWSEPVASGAKQTLSAVSSFHVLRIPS